MKRFLFVVLLTSVALGGGKSTIGKPIQRGRLTIFPVFGVSASLDAKYLTLDEGLQQNLVTVGELGSMAPRIVRGPAVVRPRGDASERSEREILVRRHW